MQTMKFLNSKIFTIAFFIFIVGFSHNVRSDVGVTTQKILFLSPKTPVQEAVIFAKAFNRSAQKHDLNVDLLIAIAYQESRFKKDSMRKVTGYILEKGKLKRVQVGADLCLMQISAINVEKMGLKVEQLLEDPGYCVTSAADILNNFKKGYSKKESDWWTRYNANTPAFRKEYQRHVERHLAKLSEFKVKKKENIKSSQNHVVIAEN